MFYGNRKLACFLIFRNTKKSQISAMCMIHHPRSFSLTFPWQHKFPDIFQFSLTCRNLVQLSVCSCAVCYYLQLITNEHFGSVIFRRKTVGNGPKTTRKWLPCRLDKQRWAAVFSHSANDRLANIQSIPILHRDHDIQSNTNHDQYFPAVIVHTTTYSGIYSPTICIIKAINIR